MPLVVRPDLNTSAQSLKMTFSSLTSKEYLAAFKNIGKHLTGIHEKIKVYYFEMHSSFITFEFL